MKKFVKVVAAALMTGVMALTGFAASSLNPVTAYAAEISDKGQISVNGKGTIKVKPDIAVINIGVDTENEDASAAQKENAELLNNVQAALIEAGVDENDIESLYYYMNKQYDYKFYDAEGSPTEKGYIVSHTLKVTVRDIEKAGAVVDAASNAGANNINGINFNVDDTEAYYQEALKLAVANAKVKGDALAGVIGVQIALPSEIYEQSNGYVVPVYMEKASGVAYGDSGTNFTPGDVEISASVTVVYEYDK